MSQSANFRAYLVFSLGLAPALALGLAPAQGGIAQAAEEGSNLSQSSASSDLEPVNGAPWHLYGGVGGGYGLVTGNGYNNSPHGPDAMVSGDLSFEAGHWVFDGGAGWIYSSVSGSDNLNQPIKVQTRAGFGEFSPRYRLDDHWQVGPVLDVAFGTDTGFGPRVQSGAFATPFLGLKGVYETALGENWALRGFAEALSDMTFGNSNATLFVLGVQIGLPLSGGSHASEEPRLAGAKSGENELNSDAGPGETQEIKMVLDPERVFFRTSSTELRPEVKDILEQIGAYMAQHPDDVKEIDISGHADRRGPFQYNMKLSKSRADSVREAMSEAGVSADKMKVEAFSYLKPVDPGSNPSAWAKNRRVEIKFRGVRNPGYLKQKIRELTDLHVASSVEFNSHGGQG